MLQPAASVDGLIDWEAFLELDPTDVQSAELGNLSKTFMVLAPEHI